MPNVKNLGSTSVWVATRDGDGVMEIPPGESKYVVGGSIASSVKPGDHIITY